VELGQAFGSVLKSKRQAAGLTQEELAFQASLHTTSISYFERGLRQPTLHTVFLLSKVLDLKASDMVGEVEDRKPVILTSDFH
jgi:transcriptional regulator with XRE-family HTH domain